jgi:steroid delta-isomerase-like uncharacterized protein
MTLTSNKAVARRFYEEVINAGRTDVLDEIVAEDAVDHAGAGRWTPGRAGFLQHVTWLRETLGEVATTVTGLVAEDDRVVVFWSMTGVHRGELFGVPATGRRVGGDSISWLTIRDGRIVEYSVLPDRQQFLRQLGGAPA